MKQTGQQQKRNNDFTDQPITSGSQICKIDCPKADLMLRLPVLNRCDHECVTLTLLCTMAMLTTRKLDR